MSPRPESLPPAEVPIRIERDIVSARRAVRDVATTLGFTQSDVARLVTAASELARNIFRYAGSGVMHWTHLERNGRLALELKFVDNGPGIEDVSLAMAEGYTTGGGLGIGLPGARRLSDEMEIDSTPGQGTTVILRKWRRY